MKRFLLRLLLAFVPGYCWIHIAPKTLRVNDDRDGHHKVCLACEKLARHLSMKAQQRFNRWLARMAEASHA